MSSADELDLLDYYIKELDLLRREGKDFAQRFPKIASRLDFRESESLDPHTERLIESVAFLTARVHRDIDREYSQIASNMLSTLCPSLLQPVPSLTIAQFQPDKKSGRLTSPLRIPMNSVLSTKALSGEICKFRTVWDLDIIPLEITSINIDEQDHIIIKLKLIQGVTLSELSLDKITFHLTGDWRMVSAIYETVASRVKSISVRDFRNKNIKLESNSIRLKGFNEDEMALPQPAGSHQAYALLQEYFSFPRKFQFFTIERIKMSNFEGDQLIIDIDVGALSGQVKKISRENLMVNCVPIINLFPKMSEPIKTNDYRYEELLVADQVSEASTEIHSVLSVTASGPHSKQSKIIPEFSTAESHIQVDDSTEGGVYWSSRRQRSLRKDITGSDIFLSFINQEHNEVRPDASVIYANLLCTNRKLAQQIPQKANFECEGISTSFLVQCLYEPSRQTEPPFASQTIWRLSSLLTLNHCSLVTGETGIKQLRQMLSLFASNNIKDLDQIRGLLNLQAKGVTSRFNNEAWRGFCRGVNVTIDLNPDAFVGSSMILFSKVLAHFFSLYTTINSFVSLSVTSNGETLIQIPAMSGRQEFI
ncbi:MAG: hypothetical protein CBC42_04125 [Betaproteobacteria bacterium TMED82]|nr:MAG: hypothetical protein CBC42_04125 [Betaproteobacteria bacterium TMED82]